MKTHCFAYYVNGEWVGWYGDTWGTVSKTPKLYSNLNAVLPTVEKNFKNKLNKVNSTSYREEKEKVFDFASALSLLVFRSEELLRGKQVELRVVECPYYEGPDPTNDRKWVTADWDLVKKWAETKPNKFVGVITNN
jgi:hypothetical protein